MHTQPISKFLNYEFLVIKGQKEEKKKKGTQARKEHQLWEAFNVIYAVNILRFQKILRIKTRLMAINSTILMCQQLMLYCTAIVNIMILLTASVHYGMLIWPDFDQISSNLFRDFPIGHSNGNGHRKI